MNMIELDNNDIEAVSGGDALSAGYTLGHLVGTAYWGARDYLSEVVYPYWLD